MTRTIHVAGIGESPGKTAITIALGQLAIERGNSVGYMKPIGTQLQSHVGKTFDTDPLLARELLNIDAEIGDMEPIVYSSTFIREVVRGREDRTKLITSVNDRFKSLSKDNDLMFIEGGGTYSTGAVIDLTNKHLANLLDAHVLLVAGYSSPATIDDILIAVDFFGERLGGILFNAIDKNMTNQLEAELIPYLEDRGITVWGWLPRHIELSGVTVAELGNRIGATIITEGVDTEAYVERSVVGAMGTDQAVHQLRRTKNAVLVTGGDRSDIHTVGIEVSGVKCLVLTGGIQPSSAVIGLAEMQNVPLMVVNADTLTTIDSLEEILRGGRAGSAKTVSVMKTLLSDYADITGILGTN